MTIRVWDLKNGMKYTLVPSIELSILSPRWTIYASWGVYFVKNDLKDLVVSGPLKIECFASIGITLTPV